MTTEYQFSEENEPHSQIPADLSTAPIRTQLLWSSFFPLALFGLLTTLAIVFTISRITQNLAFQRNSAQIEVISSGVEEALLKGLLPGEINWKDLLSASGGSATSDLYLISQKDNSVLSAYNGGESAWMDETEVVTFLHSTTLKSSLFQSPSTQNEVLITRSSLPDSDAQLVWVESWKEILAPAASYQVLLIVLVFSGVFLSLVMLSLAINRIIHPITGLTENAARAIPGSVFRPIKESGPKEIRLLIRTFNQMVIRLARQQTSLRQYAHKALLSQEEERQRLSRELHDGTLQDLVGLYQRVELCSNELSGNPQSAHERLDEIHDLINQAIEDVRNISIALRPPILEDLGLVVTVESLCKEINQDRSGLKCNFILIGNSRRLAADMELAVYRVIQEALNNIRKHVPDASEVKVELTFTEKEVKATISNNGRSFTDPDVQKYVTSGHIGLAGMYERARLFGGSLKIKSAAGENTLITLRLPLEPESNP